VRLNFKLRKFLAIVVLISVLWSYLPLSLIKVNASSVKDDKVVGEEKHESYYSTTDSDFNSYDVAIEKEEISQRSLSSKTFRKVDGSYEVAMFS